jgi:hypothetical protein
MIGGVGLVRQSLGPMLRSVQLQTGITAQTPTTDLAKDRVAQLASALITVTKVRHEATLAS